MEHYVYQIKINNVVRYIGRTNDLDDREKQHNYQFRKGTSKKLYDYIRTIDFKDDIILEPIYIAKSKVEAKRFEMYTILWYYFEIDKKQLKQNIPNIKDFG